jgi:hypothetical protein
MIQPMLILAVRLPVISLASLSRTAPAAWSVRFSSEPWLTIWTPTVGVGETAGGGVGLGGWGTGGTGLVRSSPYDRYSPRLHKHAAALITEWCDAVLFASRKFRTQTEETGFGRKRTIAHAVGKDGGERVLRTIGGPSCVAKNRYNLDSELPLEWNALLAGISAGAA